MIMVWDCETTGLPSRGRTLDDPAQPRLVQLAALLLEPDGTERASLSVIVNPGVPIPPEAVAVHGIDNALAARAGIPERWAVTLWHQLARRAGLLVAHNIGFDWLLMSMAWARAGGEGAKSCEDRHGARPRFCTMEAAAPVVNLPPTPKMLRAGFTKPKAPKLAECVRHFWDEDHAGAHDALADVRATARLYFRLQQTALAAVKGSAA